MELIKIHFLSELCAKLFSLLRQRRMPQTWRREGNIQQRATVGLDHCSEKKACVVRAGWEGTGKVQRWGAAAGESRKLSEGPETLK